LIKNLKKLFQSTTATFAFFASLASIVSLFGWAAEKFLNYAPETLGLISFFVIGFVFLFAIFLLFRAFIASEKIKEIHNDYILSHTVTHQLRNAITALQELEFNTLSKIDNTDSTNHFEEILENDRLKRQDIFRELGSKVTGSVAKQITNNFLSHHRVNENVRATIKSLIPENNNQLKWEIRTSVVDPKTYDQDTALEDRENEIHFIEGNTDFKGILIGKEKYFAKNDLAGMKDANYSNSSKDWRDRYNATLVVPIKNKPDGKNNTVYYGFLTVDCMNTKKHELFTQKLGSPSLNIVAHAADALAVWFIKNDNHTEILKGSFTQREGLLIFDQAIKTRNKGIANASSK